MRTDLLETREGATFYNYSMQNPMAIKGIRYTVTVRVIVFCLLCVSVQ